MDYTTDPKVSNIIKNLYQKYDEAGQDLASQLEGFLYSDYLTYWDYIHLDTLLSIQNPKTNMPDEQIFIISHQITELYFKMIIVELEQVIEDGLTKGDFCLNKIQRINCYFEQLLNSLQIMLKGIEQDQFLKFRLSLAPASGFQSIQFRVIEILTTEFNNLVDETNRDINDGVEEIYKKLYWRKGAIDNSTGKETLTLVHFEKKYRNFIISKAFEYKNKNLAYLCKKIPGCLDNDKLVAELKRFDSFANITWPLIHYKTAAKHLLKDSGDISSTGGTNWRKYLPPKFRKVIFFPELWSQDEKENWGKSGLF